MPPFAIAAVARAICSGVTAISCPIDITAFVSFDHFFGERRIPFPSPGRSMPLFEPKPKLVTRR